MLYGKNIMLLVMIVIVQIELIIFDMRFTFDKIIIYFSIRKNIKK